MSAGGAVMHPMDPMQAQCVPNQRRAIKKATTLDKHMGEVSTSLSAITSWDEDGVRLESARKG